MDFEKKHADIYTMLKEKYEWIPVLSLGRKEELRMFYDLTQTEQFREIYRPVQLRQVREILKGNYRVLMANSGMQAMTILSKERPDLIFLDYDMPVMDGRMTLEKIRTYEKSRDLPVVFLTAINSKEKILAIAPLNPADYLLKPVNAKRILETAERIIGL